MKAMRRRARDVWHHSRPSWAGSSFSPSKLGPPVGVSPELTEPDAKRRLAWPFVWAAAGVLVLGGAVSYWGSKPQPTPQVSAEAAARTGAETVRSEPPSVAPTSSATTTSAPAQADATVLPTAPSAMAAVTDFKAVSLEGHASDSLGPAPTLFLDRVELEPGVPGHEPVTARFMRPATKLATVND